MNTPKIIFKYSRIYNGHFRQWVDDSSSIKDKTYPSGKEILDYISKIKNEWAKIENTVLQEISQVTNLTWDDKQINCYVVGRAIPFSDPLTLKITKDKNRFIDILIHEIIHQLFNQPNNQRKVSDLILSLQEQYKEEVIRTILHILVYAVHTHIYTKFFNNKRLEADISFSQVYPEHKRAWEIVNERGYREIIQNFF